MRQPQLTEDASLDSCSTKLSMRRGNSGKLSGWSPALSTSRRMKGDRGKGTYGMVKARRSHKSAMKTMRTTLLDFGCCFVGRPDDATVAAMACRKSCCCKGRGIVSLLRSWIASDAYR